MPSEFEKKINKFLNSIIKKKLSMDALQATAQELVAEYPIPTPIIFNVGGDELSDYELEKLGLATDDIAIYNYAQGSYDGRGYVIVKRGDGSVQYASLGHCSCYGPTDQADWSDVSLDSILDNKDELGRRRIHNDYDYDIWIKISEKAREIWA